MATNGLAQQAFAPVLAALDTMQGNVDRAQKGRAHEFLETFQKSTEAWTTTFAILQAQDASAQAKLFAATTLKGKVSPKCSYAGLLVYIDPRQIVYDLHQLPRESLPSLRDTLLGLLSSYRAGPKPIRIQLCVCLANLAIQMTEWKDVLPLVVSTLGSDPESLPCALDFLRVLPEEVTEGRKINLTIVIDALSVTEPFEAAIECMSALFKETRDVDECLNIIQTLYPRVIALRPMLQEAAETEDTETFKGLSRLFAEAGESWVVLIARMPEEFRALVEVILESAARDQERDVISLTFNFWYELKQYLTLDKYIQARLQYVDIYSKLVDIMIGHLEYPKPESGNERDLFEGDREQEEKFREFRHQMGDVLKDCCEVIGVTECLQKSYALIENWVSTYGPQASAGHVPEWQKLEAPLFSMRAMGRMVPSDENIMLPRLMPLIVQIPDHQKVRFQAVMALGRYTEWTSKHPETLQPQLNYIMAAFDHTSKEVIRAAALSFKFFCNDCADLLKDYIPQLQHFYESVLDKLPPSSQDEVTDGVASVIAKLPPDQIYPTMKLYCDPVIKSLMTMAQHAVDEKSRLALADKLQLITIFMQWIQPYVEPTQPNPAVKYCEEIFPVLAIIAENNLNFTPVLERVCRCWRYMVLSYRTSMAPLLPQLAEKLAAGFAATRQGCFLWASDAIVREFSDGAEHVDPATTDAIFHFFETQAKTFLKALNDLPPEELPDVIEDFYRLCLDSLLYYPYRAISSPLMGPIIEAASTALTLLKEEPLLATLHFLRDFLAYGSEDSLFEFRAPALEQSTRIMVQRLMTGMMYSFPRDCFPDASGVLLALFQLMPQQVAAWVRNTVALLPPGSITPQESERLLNNITQRIQAGDLRKIRTLLQDFTNSYRRRNVAPREGLGRLEATRFRFAG
ncbi:Nuclear import receptor [Coniosporium tulheliwenetii]|uniref:Nuclear import receptor n=1 Tax=Coniosporium tulheliwenetii TaxID=3383036 RepID=A0ACC2YKT9_9PEZI|nr:Nuclear import receptor [Cladosporium sp. JES 115]